MNDCPDCGAAHDMAECAGAVCDCCRAIQNEERTS